MDNGFSFGGRCTEEFNMYVERYPAQNGAVRKRKTISVPGRNGDLHFSEEAFENYQQPYECYFHGPYPTPEQAHAIKGWLLSSGAYRRLEDVYDPMYFRLATFVGPLDVDNRLNRYGKCTVIFDCDPRAFLKSGEQIVTFEAAGRLYNPTSFAAKPVIWIYGSGAGTLTVGGTVVEIKAITDQFILDSDTENAYRHVADGAPENKNGDIHAPVFPELLPGENVISWTGDITRVEIKPRWWTL